MYNYMIKYSLLAFPIASSCLGVWQVQRLQWKKNLVADLDKKIQNEPIDLLAIKSLDDLKDLEYNRVKVKGKYDVEPSHQIYLRPRSLVVNDEAVLRGRTAHQPLVGVNVITPFLVDGSDLRIIVNRGWLALRGDKDTVDNSAHLGLGSAEDPPIEVVGVLRSSDDRPRYGAKNDMRRNVWQFRDVEAMSKALNTAPIYIEAGQDTNRKEGPIGGQTLMNIRNEHLNYAITWFGLALASYWMWHTKYGKRSFLFIKRR